MPNSLPPRSLSTRVFSNGNSSLPNCRKTSYCTAHSLHIMENGFFSFIALSPSFLPSLSLSSCAFFVVVAPSGRVGQRCEHALRPIICFVTLSLSSFPLAFSVFLCFLLSRHDPYTIHQDLSCASRGLVFMFITFSPSPFPSRPRRIFLFVATRSNQDVSERAWVGADFFKLPEEKQKRLLSTGNMLFCRTEPKDKQRLVKMLQDMGEVGAESEMPEAGRTGVIHQFQLVCHQKRVCSSTRVITPPRLETLFVGNATWN